MTCHRGREGNTNGDRELLEIFNAMEQLDFPVIYPVHPRNKQRSLKLEKQNHFKNILLAEPVGYLESIYLVDHAKKIVTDSGGLQREVFFAGKKCVTILNFVCWPETMVDNRNQLAKPETRDILNKLNSNQKIDMNYHPFGDGHASERIVAAMENFKD